MNICTIFLHIKNKNSSDSSIAELLKNALQKGQKKDMQDAAPGLFHQQGENFQNVCYEDDLLAAKQIKNTTYFVFADDPSVATDCLNIDVVFSTKKNDLTKVISEIFKNIQKFLKNTDIDLDYQRKEVKIYKVVNGDIAANAPYVTATFENKNIESTYELYEYNVMKVLFVLSLLASAILYFISEMFFGIAVSAMITLLLACISGYIKRKIDNSSVKIIDFTNLFNNESPKTDVSGKAGSDPSKKYEVPDYTKKGEDK